MILSPIILNLTMVKVPTGGGIEKLNRCEDKYLLPGAAILSTTDIFGAIIQ
jgi:hypothetical protein